MKVSLVVASGAHEGKVIAITGSQFLIGRDSQCNLRPASQAISKQHCGILVRNGQVFVKDYGSTNGTLVNDELVKGIEVVVDDGASVKLGPLDFKVRIEQYAPDPDGTPLPETSPALDAVKAVSGTTPKAPARDATPSPARPARPAVSTGSKETPALTGSKEAPTLKSVTGSKETPALKPAPTGSKEAPALKATAAPPAPKAAPAKPAQVATSAAKKAAEDADDHDKMAAMLLGMDEDGNGDVPDGSTIMEMPKVDVTAEQAAAKAATGDKKPVQSREEMSSAASEILRKMMRRPK